MSVDLQQFTEAAKKTESIVPTLLINETFLNNVLEAHIASGKILDQIKKHAFYGSKYNLEKYKTTIESNVEDLNKAISNIPPYYIKEPNHMGDDIIPYDSRIIHALLGVATESTELCEALHKYLTTGVIDLVNISEEMADIAWYQAVFYDAAKLDWEQSYEVVLKKLEKRYQDKFSKQAAEQRNLDAERKILETQQ
jgi:NTP pyrophosphatase (non-canonical NTP hydrolase)